MMNIEMVSGSKMSFCGSVKDKRVGMTDDEGEVGEVDDLTGLDESCTIGEQLGSIEEALVGVRVDKHGRKGIRSGDGWIDGLWGCPPE